ncbi:MAG TPA: UDP-3-O-(3-hydroxymyristoyl)glucosamine N-acyltransferase [Chitinophagales bacterium]|nr:UDP-3-O-(3-hydroxymyristoyl)glucosamine N-acyltransferase [Chitinophagales bacterium]HMZ33074.1 UDP-3-O-(3-hydroxymyristoyl)glucosamine N-acyltransferase [Chitinophagales bacterium]HNA39362.1 UDP-3-O-(3-hydroxymyristoyl)glucosamine N-acyltransferase [Chitinophagales bacterium]HNC73213.1 UDP-3-O-(3-hydroxymyristoyl)glucosamine N-acyltransferase [Chitinophagales bacterium]HNF50195.1 UDP-3-O-(3-hydroxymyristoyl)glucosamine N-acyltransferase [Chitinophagales bacterium]
MTIQEIATIIHGDVVGNAHHQIIMPAKIEEATSEHITFLANKKYLDFIANSKAGCVIISKALFSAEMKGNFILVDDAYTAFTKLLSLYVAQQNTEISPQAFIHQSAKIGQHVQLFPFVFIGENVRIGNNCIIYSNVSIYKDCVIGDNCIIHANAVIGSDGFGFAQLSDGSYQKIPQLGNVIIEDDCEIGANTCIDRATLGSTIIRKGVKLDNLIQVAHNVEIGEHTVIAAQTGISGSTKIGHHNRIGGQVGFVGHIHVAPYTQINAQSAVASSVKNEHTAISGTPAIDIKQHFKATVVYKNLPELERTVRNLQAEIEKLKSKD